jgi:hypothetical protein
VATRPVSSAILLAAALTAGTLSLPATVQAQHRVSVGIGYGYGYGYGGPAPWMYGQWGPWGPWGPYGAYGWYGPWGPYSYGWGLPYPYYSYYNATGLVSRVKIQAADKAFKDAEVYVDGARAGTVEDFDGRFQSLHVLPGSREIVIYKEGFRSARHAIYIQPFDEQKIKFTLEPLREGEPQDPRPTLPPPGVEPDPAGGQRAYGQPLAPPADLPAEPQPQQRPTDTRVGTLSIRMQAADAEIFVDGERWTSTQPDRLSLKLPAGRHKVEVRKEGFVTYTEDVLIRDQATITLNVALTKK